MRAVLALLSTQPNGRNKSIGNTNEPKSDKVRRYEAFREIQQLNTVIERELYYARKLFPTDQSRASEHLRIVGRLESKRQELQRVLDREKLPTLPITIDRCDQLIAEHQAKLDGAVNDDEVDEEDVAEELEAEYVFIRTWFKKDRKACEMHFEAVRSLECDLFEADYAASTRERLLKYLGQLKERRHQLWLENFCSGCSLRVKILVLICAPRILKLKSSVLEGIPLEVFRVIDAYLFPVETRTQVSEVT